MSLQCIPSVFIEFLPASVDVFKKERIEGVPHFLLANMLRVAFLLCLAVSLSFGASFISEVKEITYGVHSFVVQLPPLVEPYTLSASLELQKPYALLYVYM